MEFLNTWLQGIIVAVVIASIIQMILPNGNNKKYIKVVLGVYVVFQIITPVINKFFNSDFEVSSLIDIDKYTKKMETYEVSSKNTDINKTNEDSIKQIYITNLKKDIKTKLEDKDYLIKDVEVQVEDNANYGIKSLTIYMNGKNDNKEENNKEKTENNIHINEIEKIEINVSQNNETNKNSFNNSENEEASQTKGNNISNEEKNLVVFIIILIITVIIINTIWNNDNKKESKENVQSDIGKELAKEQVQTETENSNELEQRLENILQNIQGVGKVKVLITYSQTSQVVAMYNEDSTKSDTEESDKRWTEIEK